MGNPVLIIIWFLVDVFQLYAFLFAIMAYHILADREVGGMKFGNQTTRRAYLAFMILYFIATFPFPSTNLICKIEASFQR